MRFSDPQGKRIKKRIIKKPTTPMLFKIRQFCPPNKIKTTQQCTTRKTWGRPCEAASCGGASPAGRASAPGPSEESPSGSAAGGGARSPAAVASTAWRSRNCPHRNGGDLSDQWIGKLG